MSRDLGLSARNFHLGQFDHGAGLDLVEQGLEGGIIGAAAFFAHSRGEALQGFGRRLAVDEGQLDLIQGVQQAAGAADGPLAAGQGAIDILQGDQGVERANARDRVGGRRPRRGRGLLRLRQGEDRVSAPLAALSDGGRR